jgi:hypothetical protein
MFSTKVLSKLPKVKAWIDDPDGKVGDRFRDMAIAEFKKYQEEHLSNYKRDRESKAGGKRRAQVVDSEEEDTEFFTRHSKKGKGHRVVNSSDLDKSA